MCVPESVYIVLPITSRVLMPKALCLWCRCVLLPFTIPVCSLTSYDVWYRSKGRDDQNRFDVDLLRSRVRAHRWFLILA